MAKRIQKSRQQRGPKPTRLIPPRTGGKNKRNLKTEGGGPTELDRAAGSRKGK